MSSSQFLAPVALAVVLGQAEGLEQDLQPWPRNLAFTLPHPSPEVHPLQIHSACAPSQ